MNYPFWDAPLGHGVLMAAVSIVHVFLSHFAIGGGLYLVVEETFARRAGDAARLSYLRRLSRFFLVVTVVFGAMTGVGIWFVIGLLSPAATGLLIGEFVWVWAIEWTFFLVEIASVIVYTYGWDRMSPRRHLQVGWIYFAAAWLSLVAIDGIIGFMLTPGDWLTTGALADGFFHPTYWSSLVFRTGICLLLAGIWAMLLTVGIPGAADRARIVRRNALWSLAGFLVVAPSALWYWRSVPGDLMAVALASAAAPDTSLRILLWVGAALAVVLLLGAALPRRFGALAAVLAMMLSLDFFGSFEWLRESARKPFVVYGHMYANSVEVARVAEMQEDGMLPQLTYRTGDDGADLFRYACRSCHTWNGYRPLEPLLAGADADYLAALVTGADLMRGNMPPFAGTPEEAAALGEHLAGLAARRSLAEVTGASGDALGEHVFRRRCGTCHEFGGSRDNRSSLVGLDRDEIEEILDNGSDYDDRMPDFTGTDEEREALIAWMLTLEEEEQP